MYYRQASNQYINDGMDFTIDGNSYPFTALGDKSPEILQSFGLELVVATNQRRVQRRNSDIYQYTNGLNRYP